MTSHQRSDMPGFHFHFCPRCGKEGPTLDRGRCLRCDHCDFRFYFNSAAAAGAFVRHGESLVVCIRAKDPAQGMLDLPGGFIEFDESIEAGLRREIREELNLETSHYNYLVSAPNDYVYAGVHYKTTDLFFLCEAPDIRDIRAADDVRDYVLLRPSELDPARLAFPSTRAAYAALMSHLDRRLA